MKFSHRNLLRIAALPIAVAGALAACGGGGGSSSGTAPMMSVAVMDAPTMDFDHVWVTVREIDFHTSNAAAPADPGWLKYPLAAPVTVDLTTLTNGTMQNMFQGIALPVGNYQQIRLKLVADDAALAASASAAGLAFNDQVDWTNALGVAQHGALEIPDGRNGISLSGSFRVAAGTNLDLAIDFDIGHDVVKFDHGGIPAFTLKPNLHYYDLAHVGAIQGKVSTAGLCTSAAAASPVNCAFNLVVKAELPSKDGTHHDAVRFTGIRPDGSFTLFPLPVAASSASFDVLVRGRNMDTILVRGVTVNAGTTPAGTGAAAATLLSAAALPLTMDTEYTANASPALSPTGAWMNFYQTLPGSGETPYEVRYRHVNPFTGTFQDPIPLSAGPIQVGAWVSGGSPVLAPATPLEGAGGFQAWAGAPYYTRTQSAATLSVPAGSPALFTVPALPVDATVASSDSIAGSITQATPGRFDKGFLVVVRRGTIVDTIPLDAILAQNAGAGGSYSIASLPGGSASKALPDAYYALYARVWNSAHPFATLMRIPAMATADLRNGSATGVDFSF